MAQAPEIRADEEGLPAEAVVEGIREVLQKTADQIVLVRCRDETQADEISAHLNPDELRMVQYVWPGDKGKGAGA